MTHTILSAGYGGAAHPWHHARTGTERRQVIHDLLGDDDGHVLFYLWDRPAGDEFPGHQLKIVYNGEVGAAHFHNADARHGPPGAWLARAERPPADPPEVVYDPWDPGRVTVSASALLPIAQLRAIAEDYATTGRRPVGTWWSPVAWV